MTLDEQSVAAVEVFCGRMNELRDAATPERWRCVDVTRSPVDIETVDGSPVAFGVSREEAEHIVALHNSEEATLRALRAVAWWLKLAAEPEDDPRTKFMETWNAIALIGAALRELVTNEDQETPDPSRFDDYDIHDRPPPRQEE